MTLASRDFQFVRDLVLKEAAIVIEPGREYLVESRLAALARTEGVASLEELLVRARAQRDDALQKRVVEAMTINETSFLRDPAFFEALRTQVLPDLAEKRKQERKLSIWCGAASSGQEPYSVAMTVNAVPKLAGYRTSILATDYCESMLARIDRGAYSALEVNRGLPAPLLQKHFDRASAGYVVKPHLRVGIEVRQMNLAGSWPALPPMDLVLLRNVLIYFGVEKKREILSRVRRLLRSDGYLALGSAETTINLDGSFERVEVNRAVLYRLREG